MKKLWKSYRHIVLLFILWRILFGVIELISPNIFPIHLGYLATSGWANFDRLHYISRAIHGYFQYEQVYFPLYPSLIRFISPIIGQSYLQTSLLLSRFSFFVALLLLFEVYRYSREKNAIWTIIILLIFPTSFYFFSAYTESLYFFSPLKKYIL